MSQQETEEIRKTLPPKFERFIKEKLAPNGTGGRKNIVQELGSMDKVLSLLRYFSETGDNYRKTARKYSVSKMTIYRFINEIEEWLEPVKAYLRYQDEYKLRDFREYPIVQKWEKLIRRSGSLSQLSNISLMANICGMPYHPSQKPYVEDWRCRPDKFDLDKAQEFVDLYLKAHPDKKQLPQHLRLAIRHFLMVAKGINIPRGFGGQYGLSGEKSAKGDYAHIKLLDEEIEEARSILKELDGLEALTFFDWGIESCARYRTIAKTEISKIEEHENFITVRVYESKTDTTWTKYLLVNKYPHARETANEIAELMKEKKKYLFVESDERQAIRDYMSEISTTLKEVYKRLGKTDEYFYKKPIHTLRHIGAHLWLRRTNYDYSLVAELGGWASEQTLKKFYGKMTPEIVLGKIQKLGQK